MPLSRSGSQPGLGGDARRDTKPHDDWMDDGVLVYADARDRHTWPILAELQVPHDRLPRAYVLHHTQVDWLHRPCQLPTSRVTVVPLTHACRTTMSPPPETHGE